MSHEYSPYATTASLLSPGALHRSARTLERRAYSTVSSPLEVTTILAQMYPLELLVRQEDAWTPCREVLKAWTMECGTQDAVKYSARHRIAWRSLHTKEQVCAHASELLVVISHSPCSTLPCLICRSFSLLPRLMSAASSNAAAI